MNKPVSQRAQREKPEAFNWQVRVGRTLVIAQTGDRFDAIEFAKVMRKHYAKGTPIVCEYIGKWDGSPDDPTYPENVSFKGTRRSLLG